MPPSSPNRRQALQSTGLGILGFAVTKIRAADSPLTPLNRFPRMLQEHYVQQLRRHDAEHHNRIFGLKTRQDAEAYVLSVRKKIQQSFGPWPEKTDLNPRITGRLERKDYVIEKIIFESRPNFPVTANLYLPTRRDSPVPGVIGTCGHSLNGKAAEAYQSFAQGLARQGYACLLYDPIGQGERLQYGGADRKSKVRPGVGEHIHAGNQQLLIGEFFGSWRAWDGIRALDYLLARPEVDPKQIGVTGNSGGGTMTTWLAGVENRWTMAAPSCFVTTFRHNLENELPADSEQCPPRALALGLDHCDFLAALAPRPVAILAKEKDFFDARGAEEAWRRLTHLYSLLGSEENARLFIGPTYHGFTQENREAMYRLFNDTTGVSDQKTEPAITLEKDADLWCTPSGQVAPTGASSVFDFTAKRSAELRSKRPVKTGEALRKAVREQLKMPVISEQPGYRILRHWGARSYPARNYAHYVVETEPGIQCFITRLSDESLVSRPPKGSPEAVLYLSHLSADDELRNDTWLRERVRSAGDTPFFACDLRGTGESQPDTCGRDSFLKAYGSDFFYASHALMLDKPVVGQRTFDTLRVIEWMRGLGHTKIHLIGKGRGAIPATFAALLSSGVKQITLRDSLNDYAEVAESEFYETPISSLLPDVLLHFDLPDCYAELRGKNLERL